MSSSKKRVFRRIEFFEKSNFFKNLNFRRIDKTFLWMFVFFHFLPILQNRNIWSFKFITKIWFFSASFWRLTILIFLQFYIVTWSFWRMKIIYLRITSKTFVNFRSIKKSSVFLIFLKNWKIRQIGNFDKSTISRNREFRQFRNGHFG